MCRSYNKTRTFKTWNLLQAKGTYVQALILMNSTHTVLRANVSLEFNISDRPQFVIAPFSTNTCLLSRLACTIVTKLKLQKQTAAPNISDDHLMVVIWCFATINFYTVEATLHTCCPTKAVEHKR